MLIEIIIFFLAFSLVFYVLFGGADFGAGVLELISGKSDRETIAHAIGPVWEANHVWLILVVTILFMGFPRIYSVMSLYLHIPLLILLIGIVLRGTAFAFMHYDAIRDRSTKVYSLVFKASSALTPIFLGNIVGAVALGKIDPGAETFAGAFITPWLNLFSFSVGFFAIILFTFLAAVYLIGEAADDKQRDTFKSSALKLNIAAVITGAVVFISAERQGMELFSMFLNSWFALLMVAVATLLLPPLWYSLNRKRAILSRFLAAGQVIAILTAWFWVQMPVVIRMAGEAEDITFYNSAAPDATLWQLLLALIVGSCIILPCLYYLMKVFKGGVFNVEE